MGKKILLGIGLLSFSMIVGCGYVESQPAPIDENKEQVSEKTVIEQPIQDKEVTAIPEVVKEEDSSEKSIVENEKPKEEALTENTVDEAKEKLEEIEQTNETEEIKVSDASMELFVKKNVNIRKGPGTSYDRLGALNKGEKVSVNGIAENSWYRFDYNGEVAFVSDKFLIDEAAYNDMIAKEEEAAKLAEAEAQAQAEAQAEAQAQAQAEAQAQAQNQQAAQTPAQPPAQPAASGNVKADVVAIMNSERAANGVGGITEDATLDALAQIRAEEIVGTFDHTRPNGTSCFTVLDEGGVAYMAAGENIAAGQSSAQEVMNSWMNSSGHRANILNGGFGRVGIGYVQGGSYGTYWVQIFTN